SPFSAVNSSSIGEVGLIFLPASAAVNAPRISASIPERPPLGGRGGKKIFSAAALFSAEVRAIGGTDDVRERFGSARHQTKDLSAARMSETAVGHPTISSTAARTAPRSSFRFTADAEQASDRRSPVSRAPARRRAALDSPADSSSLPETRASSAPSNHTSVTAIPSDVAAA